MLFRSMPFVRGIGPLELIIVLVIIMMIFGVGKLPQVGQTMGKALREFRKSQQGDDAEASTTSESQPEESKDTTQKSVT